MSKSNKENTIIKKVTFANVCTNILLAATKLIVGSISGSTSLLADGVHSLSDLITDVIVYFGVKISGKPPDSDHPYGHGKFETLTTLIIALVLGTVSYQLIRNGIDNIIDRNYVFPGEIVLWVAILSIISKELLYRYAHAIGKKYNFNAIIANAWHARSDALSSVAVLLGSIFSMMGWGIADHVAAILVGILLLLVSVKFLFESITELLETSIEQSTIDKIQEITNKHHDIERITSIRARKVGRSMEVDLTILMDPNQSLHYTHTVSEKIEEELRRNISPNMMIMIHIEPYLPN